MGIALAEKGGMTCPVVICDVCGERITDIHRGAYIWNGDDTADGRTCAPKFAHYGRCCRTAVNDIANADGVGCDISLSAFIVYLLHNLGVDPSKKLPEELLRMATTLSEL